MQWSMDFDMLPRVLATLSVCGSGLCFGSGLAVLGASVAFLAKELELNSSSIGQLFAFRGTGFILGVYAVSKLLSRGGDQFLSKQAICCIAVCFSCLATGSVPAVVSYFGIGGLRFSFMFQGFWFGMIDSLSFITIAEMWGQQSQQWLQLKTLSYGFGATLSPVLVGLLGYRRAFHIISILCSLSIFAMLGQQLALAIKTLGEYASWRSILWQTVQGFTKPETREDFVAPEMLVLEENLEIIQETVRDDPSFDEAGATQGLVSEALDFAEFHEEVRARKWTRTSSMSGGNGGSGGRSGSVSSLSGSMNGIISPRNHRATSYADLSLDSLPIMERRKTLSYSTREIVDAVKKNEWDVDMDLVPAALRHALADMSFWHIGMIYGFGAWISSYSAMNIGGLTLSEGAYVSALFFSFLFFGALYSIPAALYLSRIFVLRLQVILQLLGSAFLFLPITPLIKVPLATVLNGFAASCVLPMAMTVANDYGMTMDAETTIQVIVGGCFGEAVLPISVGCTIYLFGPQGFAFSILAMSSIVCVSYAIVEWRLAEHKEVVEEKRRNSVASSAPQRSRKHLVSDRVRALSIISELGPPTLNHNLSRLEEAFPEAEEEEEEAKDEGAARSLQGRGTAKWGAMDGGEADSDKNGGVRRIDRSRSMCSSGTAVRIERAVSSVDGDEWRLQGRTARRLRSDTLLIAASINDYPRGGANGSGDDGESEGSTQSDEMRAGAISSEILGTGEAVPLIRG